MSRVYNFSAGPSMLPEEVLRKAADEMLDYEAVGSPLWRCPTVQKNMRELSVARKAYCAS